MVDDIVEIAIIHATVKTLMRGFFIFVIWLIAYLVWRLIFATKGKERPTWLDVILGLAISTVAIAFGGLIGFAVVFGIYWLIRWYYKRKSSR